MICRVYSITLLMRIISTSYSKTPEYADPKEWLERISFYTGILEELAKRHEVISIERINYEGVVEQNGVHYHFIRLKRKVVHFPRRMHSLIKKIKPDVVFVNGFLFPLQVIQLRLKLGKAVKIIVLHRADKPFTGLKKYLQQIADRCINTYFFASADIGAEWIQQGIITDKNKIQEIGMISSFFQPMNRSEARKKTEVTGFPVFIWVGNLNPNKDPLTVVKAFLFFLKHTNASKLYMIFQGTELLAETEALLKKEKQYGNAVILIGEIAREEISYWYNSADFFISGSHRESYGAALSEAMSCGCIPVVTDIPSFRLMTANGTYGVLYEPGNDKDLAAALLKTMEMDIEKWRAKVVEQFKKELSFAAIAGKIERVVSNCSSC